MTEATTLHAAALCVATAIGAFVLLCARAGREDQVSRTGVRLPAGFRLCRLPALLIAPVIHPILPEATARRIVRMLDALDLYPGISAAHWIALRVVQGLIPAVLVLCLAGLRAWFPAGLAFAAGFLCGGLWLRQRLQSRELQITRELPGYLDLLTVCVEAGATLTAGVRLIVTQAPESPLRSYFDRVLREVRGGRPRAQAFAHVAQIHGVESLTTLANALSHAEGAGMSLGQILRNQSAQRTAERFARAERLAMQAPVKMLGPLILCIFPCTFIVLAVPIVVRMMEAFRS